MFCVKVSKRMAYLSWLQSPNIGEVSRSYLVSISRQGTTRQAEFPAQTYYVTMTGENTAGCQPIPRGQYQRASNTPNLPGVL